MELIKRTTCIRCGTCCQKGGPVLHHQDKQILLEGHAGHQHLITIRKGELAVDPVFGTLMPVSQELVKVRGRGNDWSCCFFDEASSSCTIYEHRFLECRLLRCWDPSELKSVIGKDTVTRAELINPGDPVMKVIEFHERQCPYGELGELLADLSRPNGKRKALVRLHELIRKDLAIRAYAITELGLKEECEPFIFGRPLFKLLRARGIEIERHLGPFATTPPPIPLQIPAKHRHNRKPQH